jgi:hypothetical protein
VFGILKPHRSTTAARASEAFDRRKGLLLTPMPPKFAVSQAISAQQG